MSPAIPSDESRSLPKGLLPLLIGLFAAALSGAVMKLLAAELPVIQIIWVRFLGFGLLLGAIVFARFGPKAALAPVRPFVQILRGLMMIGATACFLIGSVSLDFAEAISILYAYPFFIALFGPILLREPTSRASWIGIIGGFAGVLIVARPSAAGVFAPGALWITLCALMISGHMLLNRFLGRAADPLLISFWGACVVVIVTTPLVPWHWQAPDLRQIFLLLLLIGLASLSQTLITYAFARTSPAELAPYTYSEIVAAVFIGLGIFGTLPDMLSVLGMAIIILSGLFVASLAPKRLLARPTKV